MRNQNSRQTQTRSVMDNMPYAVSGIPAWLRHLAFWLLAGLLYPGCGASKPTDADKRTPILDIPAESIRGQGLRGTGSGSGFGAAALCEFNRLAKRTTTQSVRFERCTQEALSRGVTAEGKVWVHFRVLHTGKVEQRKNIKGSTRILKSEIADSGFQACIIKTKRD